MESYLLERVTDTGRESVGQFTADDLREEVEKMSVGKPWGWRPGPAGEMEAVCDYITIAVATPLEVCV